MQGQSGRCGEKKYLSMLLGTEPRFLGLPSRPYVLSCEQIVFRVQPASADFMLSLLVHFEDAGDMFLRNMWLSEKY